MNAPQIAPVPVSGKAVASGTAATAESQAVEGGESFADHLKQLDSAKPRSSQQATQDTEGEPQLAAQKGAPAPEITDLAQLRGDLLPESVKPLAESVKADIAITQQGQATLQQLAERLQSGEEVVVSSGQPVVLPVDQVADIPGTSNPLAPVNSGVPVAGNNLPPGGERLPPLEVTVARDSAARSIPQAAEPGLAKATVQSQQELPVKAGLEQQLNVTQPDKALADASRFSAILGTAAESAGQTASGANSPLTTSLAAPGVTTPTGSLETAAPRPVLSLSTPVGETAWAQEVGSRLQLVVERGNQRAEIRLNPPELGSIEVKVANDGDRTNVTFFAQNATTREALEAALPRLREMFGDSGLQLADANVSQQQTMAGEHGTTKEGNGDDFAAVDTMADPESGGQVAVRSIDGLVDTYI